MYYYRDTKEKLLDFRMNKQEILQYIDSVQIVQIDNVLVDINTFVGRRWMCDRMRCTHNKTFKSCGTCCNGGGIISPNDELKISKYISGVKKYLEKDKVSKLEKGELCQSQYQLNESKGTCIFLAESGFDRFCSLHKVADDLGIDTVNTKGFDCFIEPIEMIVLDSGMIFLTVINSSNYKISRWGNALPCVDSPFLNAPPIIETAKRILEYALGKDFYNQLKERIKIEDNMDEKTIHSQ